MERRRLGQVKNLSREELEGLIIWLAERIEALAAERIGPFVDELSVAVNVSEEWPYTVEVYISARSRYRHRGLERELEEILDQAFREFIGKAALQGLEPSG